MKSRSLFWAVGVSLAAASMLPTATAEAVAVLAPAAATAASSTAGSTVGIVAARATASYAKQTSRAVNRQRVAAGQRKLKSDSCLVRQARARAATMAQTRLLVHARLQPVVVACDLRQAAENIAEGFATGPAVVDQGWMRSTLHRRNMLAERYRTMGVAAVQDAGGTWYVALVLGRP